MQNKSYFFCIYPLWCWRCYFQNLLEIYTTSGVLKGGHAIISTNMFEQTRLFYNYYLKSPGSELTRNSGRRGPGPFLGWYNLGICVKLTPNFVKLISLTKIWSPPCRPRIRGPFLPLGVFKSVRCRPWVSSLRGQGHFHFAIGHLHWKIFNTIGNCWRGAKAKLSATWGHGFCVFSGLKLWYPSRQ